MAGSRRRSHHANAVVTGAGSGIGAAFALELAARGGQVVCSDRDLVGAQRTVDAITDQGGKARAVHCDVARAEEVVELAALASRWFGSPPSLVINNAGVGAGGTAIGETPLQDWQWTLSINLWGAIHGCHVFAPILREAGHGGIINVASAASFGSLPNMAAYNVSKAGVLSLSETLAAECSGSGVAVSVLCPTLVKTAIFDSERITGRSNQVGVSLMRYAGYSAHRVARISLNANDRGQLYCLPQIEAKIAWRIKHLAPSTYTRLLGAAFRLTAQRTATTAPTAPAAAITN